MRNSIKPNVQRCPSKMKEFYWNNNDNIAYLMKKFCINSLLFIVDLSLIWAMRTIQTIRINYTFCVIFVIDNYALSILRSAF